MFSSIVVVTALVQALLVTGDPVPTASPAFALRALGSFVALVISLSVTASVALDARDGRLSGMMGRALRRPKIVVWCVVLTLLGLVLGVLNPLLPVIVVVFGVLVLPAAADGRTSPAAAVRTVRHSPVRFAVACLVLVLVIVLSWLVALVLGFFVTGVVSAALTWLWLGVCAVLTFTQWTSLYRRAEPAS